MSSDAAVAGARAEPARAIVRLAEAIDETAVVRIGLGAVALHLVDDNYVEPQPGTSAGDHLGAQRGDHGAVVGAEARPGHAHPDPEAGGPLLGHHPKP